LLARSAKPSRVYLCECSVTTMLAVGEVDAVAGDADGLVATADEVHLDAAEFGVVDGVVGELVEGEVGAELAVEADQEVLVEGRGDALGVVVGALEEGDVLAQVDADEEAAVVARGGRRCW
jgi:hypothetical protein